MLLLCLGQVLHMDRVWKGHTKQRAPFIIVHEFPVIPSAACQSFIILFVSFPDVMVGMGFTRDEIRDSLSGQKYNEVTATYLLLGRKNEVSALAYGFIGQYTLSFARRDYIKKVGKRPRHVTEWEQI